MFDICSRGSLEAPKRRMVPGRIEEKSPMPTEPSPTETPVQTLQRVFGYNAFRPHQAEVIDAALAGRDVLAVMPTSAGKSICYQVPAVLLAERTGALTVVVSPLISLMADQVGSLRQYGVAASCLNSSLSGAEQASVFHGIESGALALLYVAPERLGDPALIEAASRRGIGLLAIDEAHCISQWGNDFRPSYQRIGDFIASLPSRPPVMALTATATLAVRKDIASALGLRNPFQVLASFDRPNLSFSVSRPAKRAQKDRELVEFCRSRVEGGKSGIVYCSTRKNVDEVCELLRSQGIAAGRYHAGLGADERARAQDDFVYDRVRVMVATNAFGMGIDKSNVNFVVHYNLPSSLENYYQEAGRAGRDGTPAECLLLYSPADVHTQEFLISRGGEGPEGLTPEQAAELREHDEARLAQMVFYCTTADCLRAFILRYFGEEAPAYCGNCGNCLADHEEVDATVDALKVLSCVARLRREFGREVGASTIVDVLRGSRAQRVLSRGYDRIKTYGAAADVPVTRLRQVIDELVYRGLLARSSGDYPTVALTQEGVDFMRSRSLDGAPFVVKVAQGKKPRRERATEGGHVFGSSGTEGAKRPQAKAAQDLDEAGQELYQRLCELRSELAREQQVPAYFIFSNATLVDMCAKRPRDLEGFLAVSGVGAKKAEAYGEKFLSAING